LRQTELGPQTELGQYLSGEHVRQLRGEGGEDGNIAAS
jgi:hypothetical protein